MALIQTGLPPEAVKDVFAVTGRKLTLVFSGEIDPRAEDQTFWLRSEFLSWHLDDMSDWVDRVRFGVIQASLVADAVFKREGAGQVIMLNLTKLKRDLLATKVTNCVEATASPNHRSSTGDAHRTQA